MAKGKSKTGSGKGKKPTRKAAKAKKPAVRKPAAKKKAVAPKPIARPTLRRPVIAEDEPFKGDEAAARFFVLDKNLARRHLTTAQKRELIATLYVEHQGCTVRILLVDSAT